MSGTDAEISRDLIAAWMDRGSPTDTKGNPVEIEESIEDAQRKRWKRPDPDRSQP